jgi:hypothetical protein
MAKAKFQQYLDQMYEDHSAEFEAFRLVHTDYQLDKKKWQDEFNRQGKPLLRIIEDYERKLCLQMESGNNAGYSARLAEKFREAIKKDFPLIDFIGVIRK